jgi:hypothetical protein
MSQLLSLLPWLRLNLFLTICLSIFLSACHKQGPKTRLSNRRVENNKLISISAPERTFQVTKDLPFLADTSFTLSEKSNAEIFIFADSKQGLIERFLQFQFESFKPHIEGTYKYEMKDSVKIGDVQFSQNYWCFDLIEAGVEKPESDIGVVQKLLNNNGLNTTGKYVGLRFVYLSEDKRSEMLIIYGEKTTVRGIDCDNEETAVPLLKQMYGQALTEFSIKTNQ